MTAISSNRTIARNTLMLYVRMFFTVVIAMYTSRVVLSALGENDFGIYNVVGGMVAMLSFVSGAMSSATQRFLSFGLGSGDMARLRRIFRSSFTIHIAIALGLILLAEVFGLWFLNNRMVIEPHRMVAANWVLQFSILTFVVSIVTVPFNALIIAHERMRVFAYISILDVVLKLLLVFLLVVSEVDKLVVYSVLMFGVQVLISGTYIIYSRRCFSECRFSLVYDRGILGEMLSFSGWSLFGSLAMVTKWQGVNMVLNLFYGTLINAAWGIAMQVNNAVNMLVQNFTTALTPPLTKSYAGGDMSRVSSLLSMGIKVSYFLTSCVAFPLLLSAPYVMGLWLVEVPEYSVLFVRLFVVATLLESINTPIIATINASGRIKWNQIIVGGLLLMTLPVSYFFLWWSDYAPVVGYITICISFVSGVVRIFILHRISGLSYSVFLGVVPMMVVTFGLNYLLWRYFYVSVEGEIGRAHV